MSKNKSDAHVKLGPKTKHKRSGYERKQKIVADDTKTVFYNVIFTF